MKIRSLRNPEDKSHPKTASNSAPNSSLPSRRKFLKWIAVISPIVAILASITGFSGYSVKDITGLIASASSSPHTFTFTVFVHGTKGLPDKILRNQGRVVLYLRTKLDPISINENGEATFKEISREFLGQKVRIQIEHPQPYQSTHPDSLYELKENGVVNLEVSLHNIDRIFGEVIDFNTETFLDSVRVSIDDTATYTDQFGRFTLNIPPDLQAKFQRVTFYKPGYEIVSVDRVPVHTQQLIQISMHRKKEQ